MTDVLTGPATRPRGAVRPDLGGEGNASGRPHRWSRWTEPLVTALLACGVFVLGFGGGTWRLSVPLGAGDLLPAYATARLWSEGAPFGNTSFGFPFGLEQRYYPTADVVQNLLAGMVAWATGNPFLGINAVFALSFPATALAALWVFRIAGLRGRWAVVAALALTSIPFHWYRLEHVHLATMWSAVLGVGLALLVGNGSVERGLRSASRLRFALAGTAVAVVVAASGVYYACFTVLLCAAAWVYRAARGARWRDLVLAATPAVTVVVVLGLVVAPAVLHARAHPPLDAVAQRGAVESVVYAGALVLALIPAPVPRMPGAEPLDSLTSSSLEEIPGYPLSEVHLYSNYGSVATLTALVVLVGGGFLLARRSARGAAAGADGVPTARPAPHEVTLGLVGLLLAGVLLFFVPWGLNYAFAELVSPDIRGWNRLVPVLFTLVFLGAGLVVQRWGGRLRPAVATGLVVLAALVLLVDSVLPHRSFFTGAAAQGSGFSGAGYTYAEDLNAAVPGDCGVVELPYIAYPEVPPKVDMGNYEPLWPAVTNPGKSWSGAAMKGTTASAWQAALGDDIDAGDVPSLVAGGFCAVHVDRRGYVPEDAAQVTGVLTGLLGEPVATGLDGNWVAYALPAPAQDLPDPDQLMTAPDGVGTFYAPPRVTPGPGAPSYPLVDPFHSTWWLPEGTAELDVDSFEEGPAFVSVDGQLSAGECGPRDVVLTVRSAGGEVSHEVRLEPGGETAFSLVLDQPVRDAQLVVATSAVVECAEDAAPTPGALALVDLTLVN